MLLSRSVFIDLYSKLSVPTGRSPIVLHDTLRSRTFVSKRRHSTRDAAQRIAAPRAWRFCGAECRMDLLLLAARRFGVVRLSSLGRLELRSAATIVAHALCVLDGAVCVLRIISSLVCP